MGSHTHLGVIKSAAKAVVVGGVGGLLAINGVGGGPASAQGLGMHTTSDPLEAQPMHACPGIQMWDSTPGLQDHSTLTLGRRQALHR